MHALCKFFAVTLGKCIFDITGGKLGHENLSHTTNEQKVAECTLICTWADTATMSLINLNLSLMPPVPIIVIHQQNVAGSFFRTTFHRQPPCLSRKIFLTPDSLKNSLPELTTLERECQMKVAMCVCYFVCVSLPSYPKVRNKNSIPPHFHPETKNFLSARVYKQSERLLPTPNPSPTPAPVTSST